MTIYGVVGSIGSGKSKKCIELAIDLAEKYHKFLLFNYQISKKELAEYCALPRFAHTPFIGSFLYELAKLIQVIKIFWNNYLTCLFPWKFKKKKYRFDFEPTYPWVLSLCRWGYGIYMRPLRDSKDLVDFLKPNTVICLDEAPIFLSSRHFMEVPRSFLSDLAQSRKGGTDLIWTAQFADQVDFQLRKQTQYYYHCSGTTKFSIETRTDKLVFKRILGFTSYNFFKWENSRARGNFFRSIIAFSRYSEIGILTIADKKVFDIYKSFYRLDAPPPPPPRYYVYVSDPSLVQQINSKKDCTKSKDKEQKITKTKKDCTKSKKRLVSIALQIANSSSFKGKAPYFSNMEDYEIQDWISANTN